MTLFRSQESLPVGLSLMLSKPKLVSSGDIGNHLLTLPLIKMATIVLSTYVAKEAITLLIISPYRICI